jgi:uncharacterized protein YdaU (DUF1376 family)
MDWFPWYPALYRADTLDLTLEQDGAYRRLIDHYMETRLPLPDNENALARIIGISTSDFRAIAEQVLCKFTAIDGELHSKRCDIELNRQDSLSKKRSSVAKAAHKKRNRNKDNHAIAKQKPGNSTNTIQDKTEEDKERTLAGSKESAPPETDLSIPLSLDRTELGEAVQLWNDAAERLGLPQMQKLTAARRGKLTARLKDCGGIDGWVAALDRLAGIPGLLGVNGGWKADFDFLVAESKFTKLMEGSYDNWTGEVGGKRDGFVAVVEGLA